MIDQPAGAARPPALPQRGRRGGRSEIRRLALRLLQVGLWLLPYHWRKPLRREVRDALALYDADVVFVSFPKSGRTWVRAMLTRLLQVHFDARCDELLEFDNLHRRDARIPCVLFTHDGDAWRRPEDLDPDKSRYADTPVVLLVRDPIDVAVSRFFHVRNRTRRLTHSEYARMPIDEFVWAPLGGVPTIVRFLNQWEAALPSLSRVLLLRYEDLRSDPAGQLSRLAAFLGVDCAAAEIDDAVDFASFDNLRKLEVRGALNTARLGARQSANESSLKVRRGKVGGYRDQLSAENVARLEEYVRANLAPRYGYPARTQQDGGSPDAPAL